jgi:hypothetical protein
VVLTPLMLTEDEQFPLKIPFEVVVMHVEMVVELQSHLGIV